METIFDTLRIYERLKDADLSEKAAKEIAGVFRESIEERLATKRDLKELEKHFDLRLKELESSIKADIIKWVAAMLAAQAGFISALVKLL
ncbi:MAG: DUF1640 domain-containing protein [Nitrospinae bacterium]|nr:DUF1640 domain-containing protein [Nitrospinota bacterium]